MNKRKGKSLKPMGRSTRHKPHKDFYTPFQELDQLFGRIFSSQPKHLANLDPFLEKNEVHLHTIKVQADEDYLFRR